MTVTVKILLIATLILSIVIPFGYYLIGEKNKKRYKRAIGTNIFFYFGAFIALPTRLQGLLQTRRDSVILRPHCQPVYHVWAAVSP